MAVIVTITTISNDMHPNTATMAASGMFPLNSGPVERMIHDSYVQGHSQCKTLHRHFYSSMKLFVLKTNGKIMAAYNEK